MPGNSRRRGAMRKTAKGNPPAGSGGQVRRGLKGKGPTPKAKDRVGHVTHKRAKRAAKSSPPAKRAATRGQSGDEWVAGRNAVVEALRGGVPASALYVATQAEHDDRLREAVRIAADQDISLLEVSRQEMDRLVGGAVHQGVALRVPAYSYAHPDDLLVAAQNANEPPLLVALDGVTDPRNLGAVVRSAAAFGAHGVVVPERRAAGMTAGAWKASAGAAARLPVARAVNLSRQLGAYAEAGLAIVGLSGDASMALDEFDWTEDGVVLVVGSEGHGLARLVREKCDTLARIPITSSTESLNAGIAAGIALYEIARRRPLS